MSSRLFAPRTTSSVESDPTCTARRDAARSSLSDSGCASRSAARGGSHAGRAGSARASTFAASYCALARSSESESCCELRHDLLRLRPLGRDRGVGERRDCGQKGHKIPARTYGACPGLRMTTPCRGRDGRTGRGRYVTRRERTKLTDERQSHTCANLPIFCAGRDFLLPQLWYGPPLVLGQAHTPRRRLLPVAALALAVSWHRPSAARTVARTRRCARTTRRSRRAPLRGARASTPSIAARRGARAARDSPRSRAVAARGARGARSCSSASRAAAPRSRSARSRSACAALRAGDVSPVEILLGSQNLDDAMTNLDNLERACRSRTRASRRAQVCQGQLAAAAPQPRRARRSSPPRRAQRGDRRGARADTRATRARTSARSPRSSGMSAARSPRS